MSEAVEEKKTDLDAKLKLFKLRADFNQAMSQFRQNIQAPKKNGTVNFGSTHYSYVQLEDLIGSIDKAIKGTGLSWRQEAKNSENGGVAVRTIISHDNGYDYQSPWLMLSSGAKPQDVGSAITYAKRYSLGTAFGVSSESDDDGQQAQNSASQSKRKSQPRQSRPANNQAKPQPNQKPTKTMPAKLQTIGLLLTQIAEVKKTTVEKLTLAYQKSFKANLEYLSNENAELVINKLTQQLNTVKAEQKAEQKNVGGVDTDDLTNQLDNLSQQNIKDGEAQTAGGEINEIQ